MRKEDALKDFRENVVPSLDKQYGPRDRVARRTAWNDYVDALQKDGRITERQAEMWVNPF